MHECYRPGDLVKAVVISLGDSRQYFLSTKEPEFGVIMARSQKSKQLLVAVSWKDMVDPETGQKEMRKAAKL